VIRILGLDVGTVRIGVALSDPLGMTAQPLEVIDRKRTDPVHHIRALCATHEVQEIVVGKPLTLEGKESFAVQSVEGFLKELRAAVSIPVTSWDERLSTAQAERSMIEGGARRKTRRENIDKIAAAIILQSFLDARGRQ